MKIEKIRNEDYNEISKILVNYWKTRNMHYSLNWAKNYLKKGHKIELVKDNTFILKENNKIIGLISILFWESKLAELRDFVIKKEFRNKGYGKKLLLFAINYCKKNKIRKIIALPFPKYTYLLKKFNFKKEGLLKDHFKKGEDLVIMSKFIF